MCSPKAQRTHKNKSCVTTSGYYLKPECLIATLKKKIVLKRNQDIITCEYPMKKTPILQYTQKAICPKN